MSLIRPRTRGALWRVGKSAAFGMTRFAARQLGAYARNQVSNWSRNRNMNSNRKYATSGRSVTYQKDVARVYRRRRMPKRKRRVWRRFIHKVRAVNEKDLGTISVVRNSQIIGASFSGEQGVTCCELYGLDGSVYPGADDLRAFTQSHNSGAIPTNSRYRFCSGVLDITFTCVADPDDPLSHTMELDLYDMVYRGYTRFGNPIDLFNDAASDTPTFGTAGNLTLNTLGATPFQFPSALSSLKILNKRKYFLSNGHSATYQIRDPKNRVFLTDAIDNHINSDAMRGWTRIVFFVFKHVPIAAGSIPPITLAIGCTRTYKVKKFESATTTDGLV